ncbi:MAG TPA: hypothetical protein VLL52_25270 [Anaerolineae bacterium]|nr:hypothetical protein [Anaerolineae bacterium]
MSSQKKRRSNRSLILLILFALLVITILIILYPKEDGTGVQTETPAPTLLPLPYDPARTTSFFQPLDNGGRQTIMVKNRDELQQLGLVQQHLINNKTTFDTGDFSHFEAIYGSDMDNLAQVKANWQSITAVYNPMPNGGQISYLTDNPDLVIAIQGWLEAQ